MYGLFAVRSEASGQIFGALMWSHSILDIWILSMEDIQLMFGRFEVLGVFFVHCIC